MPPTPKAPTPTIAKIQPPARRRKTKQTLTADILVALADNLSETEWVSNGLTYDGEEGQKNATTEARVYRRELARHLNMQERDIRTRVWETEDGWSFALLRRKQENGAS